MYLHIGNGESIRDDRIIGIFDLDTATVSSITKNFISTEEKRKNVEYADTDLPRSFLLYEDRAGKSKIKLSRISTVSLVQRSQSE
ncbi:MAG TPA: DUF370 domain-containing protein [Clostridiales bacterium]|nr:DUF370 domain-containing protein [Clostridiales bacterium]